VANLSLHRQVQLYETHAKGRKECLCSILDRTFGFHSDLNIDGGLLGCCAM
jgi:hypothetical protein